MLRFELALAKAATTSDLGFQFGRLGFAMPSDLSSFRFRRLARRPVLNMANAKVELFADPDLPSGPHQAFPLIWIVANLARQ